MVYLSHRAELTVRLDICRKVSRARCRGCHHGVTTGLSSPMGSRGHGDSENTPQWDLGCSEPLPASLTALLLPFGGLQAPQEASWS